MAYTTLVLQNPNTGELKEAPIGVSWTVLFFNFFSPLFRGDWKWALIMLVAEFITTGLSRIIFMLLYNRIYLKELLEKGFKVKSAGKVTIKQAAEKLGVSLPVYGTDLYCLPK